jgi:hypothetical protein
MTFEFSGCAAVRWNEGLGGWWGNMMNWIQNMNRCTGPASWDYGKTPEWVPLTEREPADGQMVEVIANAWTVPKWLKFDAAAKRLRDVSTGMHFWYPERMKWRPLETPNVGAKRV